MEKIERKILLENSVDRTYNSPTWGVITATTFFINILLTQSMDDMGLFTNQPFTKLDKANSTVDYSVLVDKLQTLGYTFPFMLGAQPQTVNFSPIDKLILRPPTNNLDNYYNYGEQTITGETDSKLEDVRSYNETNPFRIGFNVNNEEYVNYKNINISGVDRIKNMGNPKIYVFDTENDNNLGTNLQTTGIQYQDYENPEKTIFSFKGEGLNETNTSLSAITKEEFLFGIISSPEVESDVFIDRGAVSVLDMHLRLSEIGNMSELTKYGNGFYKINKQ